MPDEKHSIMGVQWRVWNTDEIWAEDGRYVLLTSSEEVAKFVVGAHNAHLNQAAKLINATVGTELVGIYKVRVWPKIEEVGEFHIRAVSLMGAVAMAHDFDLSPASGPRSSGILHR